MDRERVTIIVEIDLDPVPGTFDDVRDFVSLIQQNLEATVPHYHPCVKIGSKENDGPVRSEG